MKTRNEIEMKFNQGLWAVMLVFTDITKMDWRGTTRFLYK